MAIIDTNKLKFSVFGRGYDDERGNSGKGAKMDSDILNFIGYYASFDITGQYCWVYIPDTGLDRKIKKFSVPDFEDQEQTTIIPSSADNNVLLHPVNTDNNIGVLIKKVGVTEHQIVIFDLTDDTIIAQNSANIYIDQDYVYETIIVGDTIYFSNWGQYAKIYAIDVNTASLTVYSSLEGLMTANGFIDNDTVYVSRIIQWFWEYEGLGGASLGFASQWWVDAESAGIGGLPNIGFSALCANGYLYLPSHLHNRWGLGKYKGNAISDYQTPKPLKMFGDTGAKLEFTYNPIYSNSKENSCICANSGIYVTDFDSLLTLDVAMNNIRPLCMNGNYVLIAKMGNDGYTKLYSY